MEVCLAELPCVRYVAQVTNGAMRSKYSYLAMQADLGRRLARAGWRETAIGGGVSNTVTNKVTQTNLTFDSKGRITGGGFTAYLDDSFDAFKQAGDGNTTTAQMCGYAGKALYRLTLPVYPSVPSGIDTSLKLSVMLSKYSRSGVKVRFCKDASATPEGIAATWTETDSTEEANVVGVTRWGLGGQVSVPNVTAAASRVASATFDNVFRDGGSGYLWIEISLADYGDFWDYYSASSRRQYCIEGSAALLLSDSFVDVPVSGYDAPFVACANVMEYGCEVANSSSYADLVTHKGFVPRHIVSALTNADVNRSAGYPILKPASLIAAQAVFGDFGRPMAAGFFAKRNSGAFFPGSKADVVSGFARANATGAVFGVDDIAWSSAGGVKTATLAPGADVRFGLMRHFPWHYANGTTGVPDETVYNGDMSEAYYRTFGVEVMHPSQDDDTNVTFNKSAFILFGANAFVAPSDKGYYSEASITGAAVTRTGFEALKIGVNFWRIKASAKNLGRFDYVGVRAILQNRAAWTLGGGGVEILSGKLMANGTDTNTEVSASADLIGSLSALSGSDQRVQFRATVNPGDIIVCAPFVAAFESASSADRFSYITGAGGLTFSLR